MASSVFRRSPWTTVTALYVALTLAYAWPLLPVIGSALPNDTGDPGLNTWILWWNAHAVPLTTAWWNGPIFFPAPGAMALSETFLNLVPLSTPLQWAGASAVLTYNLLFLLSFPAAALSAHALARHLTGRHDAAIIAGLAFGFAPYRAAQMPHLQTLWSCWMPLGLFALHRFLVDRRPRALVLFGVCWLLNGLSTGYFLFFFSVLVGLWVLWFARSWREWIAIGVTAVLASLPIVPLLAGYQRYQTAFGLSRNGDEIEAFSADLRAVWATTPYVLPSRWTVPAGPEGELYPGVTIIVLTIVGAVVAWRRLKPDRPYLFQRWLLGAGGVLTAVTFVSIRTGGWVVRLAGITISLTHPAKAVFLTFCVLIAAVCWNPRLIAAWRRRSSLLFYAVAAVMMLLFALGPVAHVNGARFLYPAPYYWLMQLPGGHALRVPARFAMLFALCLATAAATAFSRLTPRGARAPAVGAVALAVLLDGWVFNMGVAAVPPRLDFRGLDRGAVVLELPIIDDYSDTAAMLRATQTGHALVNGFSGYLPPHYDLLRAGLAHFDESVPAALQQFDSLLVFVHENTDVDHHYKDFLEDLPDAHRVLATPEGLLYQLPKRPASADRAGDRLLPIGSIHVSPEGSVVSTAAMTDGLLATAWQTPMHQTPGDQVTIHFDQTETITGLELDLGQFKNDYPRRLRVSVSDGSERAVTAWEGSTTGLALLATVTDRARMPLNIDLPPATRGRDLVLTVIEGHPEFYWSIAELKVFGR